MGALGGEDNNENASLGMVSPTETDSRKCIEGCAIVTSTRKTSETSPHRMDQGASSNSRMVI
jgi:hypothetical protein